MNTPTLRALGAFALCIALIAPPLAKAADFPLELKRLSVTQCSMTGSLLDIDPATGNVSIELSADLACYPPVVNALANNATLSVTGPTTVGGGQTGSGTVNLQLNTGLSGVTTGVTCTADGIVANSVTVSSGWTTGSTVLCTNCGPTAPASVNVQNPSTTVTGTITFKAKCSFQDQSNANLQIVRTNILSAPPVSVLPGQAPPPPDFCTSVTELATPNGLTDAMRQTVGTVTGGSLPGSNIDFLNYTTVFGVSSNTFPAGSSDNVGFGFPGTNKGTLTSSLTRNNYISFKFRAPSDPSWNLRNGFFHATPVTAFTYVAIAPCPGQFADDANYPLGGNGCAGSAQGSDITWEITTGTTSRCKLLPGQTYYLNLINANPGSLSNSTCTGGSCQFQIRNSNNYD
jgi:hypothetical protein